MGNDKISELADLFWLTAIVKVFKMAESHVALRNTHQHCALLHRFACNLSIAGDNG
ncbi:hypothetical protein D3C85_1543080 [compost metagenome]